MTERQNRGERMTDKKKQIYGVWIPGGRKYDAQLIADLIRQEWPYAQFVEEMRIRRGAQ